MIEQTLKTISGKLKIKIPSDLDQVTLGQMMELQERENLTDLDAISILSGIDIGELKNIRNADDLQPFGNAILSLSQQIKYLYNAENIPDKITFHSANARICVKVIHNLSIEPAGAFMAARDIISGEIDEHIKKYGPDDWQEYFSPSLKACCQVLAHYFFCRVTGKSYNEYEVEEFCNEIKQLKVVEALPVARHFFTSYPGSLAKKINFFRRLRQLWRKKPGFRHSKNLNI